MSLTRALPLLLLLAIGAAPGLVRSMPVEVATCGDCIWSVDEGLLMKNDCEEAQCELGFHLLLNGQGITSIDANAFKGGPMYNISKIDLGNNFLTELPEDVFSECSSVEWLYLNNNEIAAVAESTFAGVTKLGVLYLNHNELTTLPEDLLQNNRFIGIFNFNHNKVTHLPVGIFSGRTNMGVLNLHDNHIKQLPNGIFNDLTNLRVLNIYNNHYTNDDTHGTLSVGGKIFPTPTGPYGSVVG